jgi:hypothetical protein
MLDAGRDTGDAIPGLSGDPAGGRTAASRIYCRPRFSAGPGRQLVAWVAEWRCPGAEVAPQRGGLGASEMSTTTLSTTISVAAIASFRECHRLGMICSVAGIASCHVSLVKTANIDPRPGSSARSDFSVRYRICRGERPGDLSIPANAAPPVATARATGVWSGMTTRLRKFAREIRRSRVYLTSVTNAIARQTPVVRAVRCPAAPHRVVLPVIGPGDGPCSYRWFPAFLSPA